MTPEYLKGLIEFAMFSHGLIADYRESNRPSTADPILARVMSNLNKVPAASTASQISQDPSGLWKVAGLEMMFPTQSDAIFAADVLVRAREAEQHEGQA